MRVIVVFIVIVIRLVIMIMVMLVTVILAIVAVMATSEMVAVHINATMEVTIRLVHKRAAYRLAGVAKRDGKSAFTLHDLGHRFAKARDQTRQHNNMQNPQKQA